MNTTTIELPSNLAFDILNYAKEKGCEVSGLLDNWLRTALRSDKAVELPSVFAKQISVLYSLEEDWDGEGASVINKKAIENCERLLYKLELSNPKLLVVSPSHNGAVIFRYEVNGVTIKGEIGESVMSYFVEKPDSEPEFHSFEPFIDSNISVLLNKLNAA